MTPRLNMHTASPEAAKAMLALENATHNLTIAPGVLAQSNAEQVGKIRRIVEELGLEAATPDETRAMLALKGRNRVKF